MTYTIFTMPRCKWCTLAKELLLSKGIMYHEFPLETQPERDTFKQAHPGVTTLPYITKGDKIIGGYDDLVKLLVTN